MDSFSRMTHDAPIALTPYPRPNHVRRLRQERERRRRRIGFGVAIALGLVAVGGGTAAYALDTPSPRASAGPVKLATGETADQAQDSLDAAQSLLTRADRDGVDASELDEHVAQLEHYEKMPATAVVDLTDDTDAAIESLTVEVTEFEKEQERKAEEERKAQEAAAAAAAEEQAHANTVEGAKNTARELMNETYGWGEGEFACLDQLWTKESGWNYQAQNASSGAYGIPQSLPGSKMSTVADDWETNATTQVTWGLDYIQRAYGTPCAAWGHSQATNWY